MTSRGRDAEAAGSSPERWLAARGDSAPESLRPRLASAVRASDARGDGSIADRLCMAGEALLGRLLTEGCDARSAAPDLLAADALVTYAFEAAAESDEETAASIERRAAAAMRRIAPLGVEEKA